MAEQGSLTLKKPEHVTSEVIERLADFKAALRLCIDSSGLDLKDVAWRMAMDSGHLHRMLNANDNLHFPPTRLIDLMVVCENEIPLRWLAMKCGFGLVRLKTYLEVENEQLRSDLEKEREKTRHIAEFIREARLV